MLNKDKFKVGGINYSVKEVDYVEINENKNYLGSCTHSTATIEILKNLSNDRKEQVIVHELVHAMLNEAGYDEHDEDLVNRFGIVLHQFMNDNF